MKTEILVAVITATAGWLALVLTKEQKVSEFRQKWVDELRQDIAILISGAQLIITQKNKSNEAVEAVETDETHKKELMHATQRIKYRLNPYDAEGLIDYIDELISLIISGENINRAQLESLIKSIDDTGHTILKSEWERVKKGEPWFYWSKWGFLGLAVTTFFASIL